MLGICLGHQSIAQAFGGRVVRAQQIMHGKLSDIHHNSKGVFVDLQQGFSATRYHSLVIDQTQLPECLEVTAWTQRDDGSMEEIMGVRHRHYQLEGVQFSSRINFEPTWT